MSRVRGGPKQQRRRKRVLRQAKGYYGSRSRLFRTAKEAVDHSLLYAYRHRRRKKRDFRRLWITRINAGSRVNGMSYNVFINGLKKAEVQIDRKILAALAVEEPDVFQRLTDLAKAQHE